MRVSYQIYETNNDIDFDPIAWFEYYPDVVPRIGEVVIFADMPDGWEKMDDRISSLELKVWNVQHIHGEGDIDIIVYLCINHE